uniref:Uncharacterized protein n=1 Tax=Mucochytrium quahogii TaxID=96639 RepID=A0A7S2RKK0_9STRA
MNLISIRGNVLSNLSGFPRLDVTKTTRLWQRVTPISCDIVIKCTFVNGVKASYPELCEGRLPNFFIKYGCHTYENRPSSWDAALKDLDLQASETGKTSCDARTPLTDAIDNWNTQRWSQYTQLVQNAMDQAQRDLEEKFAGMKSALANLKGMRDQMQKNKQHVFGMYRRHGYPKGNCSSAVTMQANAFDKTSLYRNISGQELFKLMNSSFYSY